jgi:hypothetical protein
MCLPETSNKETLGFSIDSMYDPINQHGNYQASVLTSNDLLLLLVEVPYWCSNHHIVYQSILQSSVDGGLRHSEIDYIKKKILQIVWKGAIINPEEKNQDHY